MPGVRRPSLFPDRPAGLQQVVEWPCFSPVNSHPVPRSAVSAYSRSGTRPAPATVFTAWRNRPAGDVNHRVPTGSPHRLPPDSQQMLQTRPLLVESQKCHSSPPDPENPSPPGQPATRERRRPRSFAQTFSSRSRSATARRRSSPAFPPSVSCAPFGQQPQHGRLQRLAEVLAPRLEVMLEHEVAGFVPPLQSPNTLRHLPSGGFNLSQVWRHAPPSAPSREPIPAPVRGICAPRWLVRGARPKPLRRGRSALPSVLRALVLPGSVASSNAA